MADTVARTRSAAAVYRVVEAYKVVCDNLLHNLPAGEHRVIAVSGAEPVVGSSTVTANLAITLAQTGARVLLIDGDLRHPSLHRTFHVPQEPGLSSWLSGQAAPEDCLHREVSLHLDLITAGVTPAHPDTLLREGWPGFLTAVRGNYDYVLVDVPSFDESEPASAVWEGITGTVLICRQRHTSRRLLQRIIADIRRNGHAVLGVVINDMKTGRSHK